MKFITRLVSFESLTRVLISEYRPDPITNPPPVWTPAICICHMINLMRSDFERQGGSEVHDIIIRPYVSPFQIPIPSWEEVGEGSAGLMITIAEPGVYRP